MAVEALPWEKMGIFATPADDDGEDDEGEFDPKEAKKVITAQASEIAQANERADKAEAISILEQAERKSETVKEHMNGRDRLVVQQARDNAELEARLEGVEDKAEIGRRGAAAAQEMSGLLQESREAAITQLTPPKEEEKPEKPTSAGGDTGPIPTEKIVTDLRAEFEGDEVMQDLINEMVAGVPPTQALHAAGAVRRLHGSLRDRIRSENGADKTGPASGGSAGTGIVNAEILAAATIDLENRDFG